VIEDVITTTTARRARRGIANERQFEMKALLSVILLLVAVSAGQVRADEPALSMATFNIDVTPPMGTPLCDALCQPASLVDDPLSGRGVILLPAGQKPIVLVALDWVGVGNEGQDAWREALAEAAETTIDRVRLRRRSAGRGVRPRRQAVQCRVRPPDD